VRGILQELRALSTPAIPTFRNIFKIGTPMVCAWEATAAEVETSLREYWAAKHGMMKERWRAMRFAFAAVSIEKGDAPAER
jgi:hypothetical protein